MIIYKTTNLIDGKFYIGQSSKNNPKYLGSGKYLIRALKKYGKENFKKEIIEHCINRDHLNEREIFWIKELKAQDHNIAYNIVDGGLAGDLGEYANNKKKKSLKKFFKNNPGFHAGSKNANYNDTIFHFYNIETKEEFRSTKFELGKYLNDNRSSHVNSLCVERRLTYKNWILFKNKDLVTNEYLKNKRIINNPQYDNKKYSFIHNSGIIEENITQNEMRKKYNISVCTICRNTRNVAYGWRIKKD